MTEDDIPWLNELSHKRYKKQYDLISTEGWFRNIVLKSPIMFQPMRTKNAFLISMLSTMPWLPTEIECHVVFICCDEGAMWEGMKLLRCSVEWARSRKCTRWFIASDTEYDIANLAKRLGATDVHQQYIVRF